MKAAVFTGVMEKGAKHLEIAEVARPLVQIRSVANMTRDDARDFLKIAADLNIRPRTTVFSLDQANEAIAAVRDETEKGSAVIVPSTPLLSQTNRGAP